MWEDADPQREEIMLMPKPRLFYTQQPRTRQLLIQKLKGSWLWRAPIYWLTGLEVSKGLR